MVTPSWPGANAIMMRRRSRRLRLARLACVGERKAPPARFFSSGRVAARLGLALLGLRPARPSRCDLCHSLPKVLRAQTARAEAQSLRRSYTPIRLPQGLFSRHSDRNTSRPAVPAATALRFDLPLGALRSDRLVRTRAIISSPSTSRSADRAARPAYWSLDT